MRRMILALVAVLLVAPATAPAGGQKGNWELGVYGGYGWLDDYAGYQPEDAMLFGLRLGHFLSNHWNLELSAQRLSTESDFEIPAVPNVDMQLDAMRLNLLYNFGGPGSSVRPFLTAGLGREFLDVEDTFDTGDWGWNAGGGLRIFLSPKFNLRLDGRYVGIQVGEDEIDEEEGNIEAALGLGLLFGGGGDVEEVSAAPNQPPTVTCAADRAEILPGESVTVRATASDPEGDPLTYAWSATSGRVTGTGASAMLDFTGTTPPASSTVTVRVSDTAGNSSSSDCTVRLTEPVVQRAEAVSCVSGGFPRNLSRLNNVDKACLDDVAQRLSSDPRARVTIIGHSDAGETTANIAQRRADAVRDYLVNERRVEASRITVRSVAATRPAGTDAAGNRRVEIWFVPEGATVPE